MPRRALPLTALKVKSAPPGRICDGGATGLYLLTRDAEHKFWIFRYAVHGKVREAGLGAAAGPSVVTLAEARDKARAMHRIVRDGRDPLDERKALRDQRAAETAQAKAKRTFGEVAEAHITSMEAGWRNPKHRAQWRATLATYAAPLTDLPVDQIDTAQVLAVLKEIWTSKPETASRVRGRIEAVLDAAKAEGHRSGDNPAAWRGHLDRLLPKRAKLSRGHHAAMKIDDVPAFVGRLREVEGVSARALEFVILTAARTGEALGAKWSEIDLERRLWVVPAVRMKAGAEHRVPLSERALEIIVEMQAIQSNSFLFPGAKANAALSNMALSMMLRRLEVDSTVHGFRSTFRDWASERTSFPPDVCEMALAHTIKSRVEAAYRRGDLVDKRRELMDAWAQYFA